MAAIGDVVGALTMGKCLNVEKLTGVVEHDFLVCGAHIREGQGYANGLTRADGLLVGLERDRERLRESTGWSVLDRALLWELLEVEQCADAELLPGAWWCARRNRSCRGCRWCG